MNLKKDLREYFRHEHILITGCCGTIGKELIKTLIGMKNPGLQITGIDNNESELFFMAHNYRDTPNVNFFVGDVRDAQTLNYRMRGITLVFHLAALKHVILSENSPNDVIQTNIVGVQNIINAALCNNVRKVIFTSSDKAVNPTSVMGTSKLMGERLMTAANYANYIHSAESTQTVFASTRFGNVMGSNGSVIPIFHKQIKEKQPVTITDFKMTRFVMTVKEAVNLVLESSVLATGGEVFVTKMPALNISDLADAMIMKLAPKYGHQGGQILKDIIGVKAGEKLYEELMNTEETRRSIEISDFFVIFPAIKGMTVKEAMNLYKDKDPEEVSVPYQSSQVSLLNIHEITELLESDGLLEP